MSFMVTEADAPVAVRSIVATPAIHARMALNHALIPGTTVVKHVTFTVAISAVD